MSKITASKVRTVIDWKKQLDLSTRNIPEIGIWEDGKQIGSRKNVVLNQQHPMRGYSLKLVEILKNKN